MPYDRPTKSELIVAVREFMEKKLLPESKGQLGFNTRVAVNVLKIVERELELGGEISTQTHNRLIKILKTENSTASNHELNILLAKEISERRLTYQDDQLITHLWQTTLDKLSVDNPKYQSYLIEK